jgi:hypothetical protein
VDDPRVIKSILTALNGRASADGLPAGVPPDQTGEIRNTNALRCAAAQALGRIGTPAKAALPALRLVAETADPEVEMTTRQIARQAIALIDR